MRDEASEFPRDELEVYELPRVGMVVYWPTVPTEKGLMRLYVFDRDEYAEFDSALFWKNCRPPNDVLKAKAAVLMAVRYFQMNLATDHRALDDVPDATFEEDAYWADQEEDSEMERERQEILSESLDYAEDIAQSGDSGWPEHDEEDSGNSYQGLPIHDPLEDDEDRSPNTHSTSDQSDATDIDDNAEYERYVNEEVAALRNEGVICSEGSQSQREQALDLFAEADELQREGMKLLEDAIRLRMKANVLLGEDDAPPHGSVISSDAVSALTVDDSDFEIPF